MVEKAPEKAPSSAFCQEQIPNICFFGLDTDTSSAPGARGVQRALGPAGAGLLEMAALGLPVPRGFCLTDGAQWGEAKMALRQLEAELGGWSWRVLPFLCFGQGRPTCWSNLPIKSLGFATR